MGQAPIKPTENQTASLKIEAQLSCENAAKALLESHILLVCIGDEFSNVSCNGSPATGDGIDPPQFYGYWGNQFNHSRKRNLEECLSILDQWQTMYSGTTTDVLMQNAIDEQNETGSKSWKTKMKNHFVSPEDIIDLDHNNESDDEELANLQYEDFAPEKSGAFQVFTSTQDGCACRLWGRHRVRECRGSIQQWQCANGPCHDQDVWEAPDGYCFNLTNEDNNPQAPEGAPFSRSPVFFVPMYAGCCMDRALSVAAAFRTNHPLCRSCGGFARPAMPISSNDCEWVDIKERSLKYSQWKRIVKKITSDKTKEKRKVVILEIGGSPQSKDSITANTPPQKESQLFWTTVRQESESIFSDIILNNNETFSTTPNEPSPSLLQEKVATLIRINEDWPLMDRQELKIEDDSFISIMLPAGEALNRIDEAMQKQKQFL